MKQSKDFWDEYKYKNVPIILAGLLAKPGGVSECNDDYAVERAFNYVDKIIERLKEEEENEDNIS